MSALGMIKKLLGAVWRSLDGLRRVLHLILLLILFILFLASLVPPQVAVPRSAALVLAPQGTLVEQLTGDPLERAFAKARGLPLLETLNKDLIDAIRAAKDDDRIKALVLRLDGLGGAGLSKLQDLAAEVASFKQSGKPVIAIGDSYARNQYYLAAQADKIYMHPMGFVIVDGYSRFLPYFKSALDKLSIDFHVWTVGEYKSFVEPITRDDMSPQDREASQLFLSELWDAYQSDVTSARNLAGDALQHYADDAVTLLEDAQGDAGTLAVNYGLVDELLTDDAQRQRLQQIVGADSANSDDFAQIGYDAYLRSLRSTLTSSGADSKVAVIVASGEILDGDQTPGTVGGDSTAKLIRSATRDSQVKALVLRVDSPGGSAFASDVILRELEVFKESGRPLVVSMGSLAASGGYWISMSADEIWASPTTLTGSIGVGATFPTFPRTLDRLGVHVDGIGTTALAGQFDPMRELGADVQALLRLSIDHSYQQFIDKVAAARDRTAQQIDQVARGRVWTGADAMERGLVDRLGNLDDAIASAAELAGLEQGEFDIKYVEPELGFAERLALEYAAVLAPFAEIFGSELALPAALKRLIDSASAPLSLLERGNDPRGIYAYCFCDVH